jgi:predicted SAM-dependent methyltransferase
MRVLQLGCGTSTYGDDRVDFIQTPATTLVHNLEEGIPFPSDTYDEVYERNLLEHLRNVGFHLQEIYRVLKPNGKLILITDNAVCWRYYLFGTHTGRYEKLHKGDCHYSIFTKKHLQNHFEKSGFKNISITGVTTDTLGRFIDYFTFIKPRIKVEATK